MAITTKLTLVAAGLMALATSGAHAGIQLATGGNSNLIFTAWDDRGTADEADDTSYVRDLGLFMNSFASAATTPVRVADKQSLTTNLNFAADAAFSAWLAAPDRVQGAIRWNVAGAVGTRRRSRDRWIAHVRLAVGRQSGLQELLLRRSDWRNGDGGVHQWRSRRAHL